LAKIQEYDIDIKTLNAIKGQVLCKIIVNGDSINGMISISIREPLVDLEWYRDIIFYLRSGQFPVTMNSKERRRLKMKANQYVLIVEILFKINYYSILLRCIYENQSQELIREFHEGICGGNFSPTATTHRIIRFGFYWPSMFKDSYAMIMKCVSCQQCLGKMKRSVMLLQPVIVEQFFSQWRLDVVRTINLKSSKGNMYILMDTYYFMKWIETVALNKVYYEELIKFLKDNTLSIFGFPDKFITDNVFLFIGSNFMEFCGEYGIIMGQSLNYHPQGNGLSESKKKTHVQILKKTIDKNQSSWHLKLTNVLWESRMTLKDSTRMSPYLLVYGKEVKMSISLKLNALIYVVNIEDTEDSSSIQRRINQLLKLEEEQRKSLNRTSQGQESIKIYFDQITTVNNFHKGELVLLWNKAKEKQSMPTKFEAFYIGPYIVRRYWVLTPI
jgi:hypothetical protein